MTALLAALCGVAFAGPAVPVEGLEWRWETGVVRRYYVETEVTAPSYLWLIASRNKQARVVSWQVRMILECSAVRDEGKAATAIDCAFADFAIKAAAMPGDQFNGLNEPLLAPILGELDTNVSAATAHMVLRHDGRLVEFELRGLPSGNRRETQMNENERLLLMRSFAGFDHQLPKKGSAPKGVWMQAQSTLMAVPGAIGTFGGTETIHVVRAVDGDVVTIESAGKGTVEVNGDGVILSARLSGAAAFSTADGALLQRVWTVLGEPTAGSPGNEGTQGMMYFQRGRIDALGVGETRDVGATEEIGWPLQGPPPTALNAWTPLGESPTTASPPPSSLPEIDR